MSSEISTKRDTMNIRLRPEDRGLIEMAAQVRGKTRTDFILDAVRAAAEEALLDRALILVTPDAYEEFQQRLDAPADPNDALKRAMKARTRWSRAAE